MRSGTTTNVSGKLLYFRLPGRLIGDSDAKNLITRTNPSLEANSLSHIHKPPLLLWGPKLHHIFKKKSLNHPTDRRPKVWQTCFIKTHGVTDQNAMRFTSQVTPLHSPQEHPSTSTVRCKTQRTVCFVGRDSSVGIATRYKLGSPGIESRCGIDFPHTGPDRPWVQPSLLSNAYRVFAGCKAAGAWRWPPNPHLAPRLKKE
jgi:hypothetical protein